MAVDKGHQLTDKELAALERRISDIYGQAAAELKETIDAYFEGLRERDEKMREMVENGEITEKYYKQWRLNQIGRGERYEALRDRVAERMTQANETAISYINDTTPGVYSLNRNWTAYTIEQAVGNADFTLWNEQAVKRIITENPSLMPNYPQKLALKRGIDLAYGQKQITSSVVSGILQGKGVKRLADDLQRRIPEMNRASAIRSARTATTNAQNAGRQDQYLLAKQMGIKVKKRWIATLDGRTRHAHAMADGQTVDVDADFDVDGYKMAYPGDRRAPGYLLYNCRCTMRTVEPEGIEAEPRQRRARDPETGRNVLISDMTYKEWLRWKGTQNGD
nr:MAG TPA: minor capsid protein [Caudoviricetes sp.]